MTNWLNGSGVFDHPSSQLRVKVEYWKSHGHFSCWVSNCSTTRIPCWSVRNCHSWPTGCLIGGTSLLRCIQHILQHLTFKPVKICWKVLHHGGVIRLDIYKNMSRFRCTHTHTHTHIYIYIYIHTHLHIYLHKHTWIYIDVHIYICMHKHTSINIKKHKSICKQAQAHVCISVYILVEMKFCRI